MDVTELESGYGLENAQSASLDSGLFRCMDDKEICCLGCCCPCVLMGRTAEFVGEDCCVCGAAWLCCEIPCCIGGLLRSRLSHQLGQDPPIGMWKACLLFHCLLMPCAICQEGRVVKVKTQGLADNYVAPVLGLDR